MTQASGGAENLEPDAFGTRRTWQAGENSKY